jgi:preprotein translocase subunit SecE
MEKVKLYLLESYNELMNKVTWPTWGNLQSTTGVVTIAVIILTLFIFLMDGVSNGLMKFIYSLG